LREIRGICGFARVDDYIYRSFKAAQMAAYGLPHAAADAIPQDCISQDPAYRETYAWAGAGVPGGALRRQKKQHHVGGGVAASVAVHPLEFGVLQQAVALGKSLCGGHGAKISAATRGSRA
jgi:hypothetical protein